MVKGDKVVCADLGGLAAYVDTFKNSKIFTVKSIDTHSGHISLNEIDGEWHLDRFVHAKDFNFSKEMSVKVGDKVKQLQETFLTANNEGVVIAVFANFTVVDFSGYQIPLMFNDLSIVNESFNKE